MFTAGHCELLQGVKCRPGAVFADPSKQICANASCVCETLRVVQAQTEVRPVVYRSRVALQLKFRCGRGAAPVSAPLGSSCHRKLTLPSPQGARLTG